MQQKNFNRVSVIPLFFIGAALGAVAMFMLDPVQGRRRRAFAREKGLAVGRDTVRYMDKYKRDFKNRAEGFRARLEKLRASETPVDDDTLAERVRAAFGRKIRHPGSIDVIPKGNGEIILAGPILSDEVQDVIHCVEKVAGVRRVINDLDVHEGDDQIPGLQGGGKAYLNR